MKVDAITLTDKELIKKITGKDHNEIHLHLDHKYYKVYYEEDYTKFEISWWLPYYYKIKNILKDNRI